MSYVESRQLALLDTLHANPSSAISCRWDLGDFAFVSLSFHICKVGQILSTPVTAQAKTLAGLVLTDRLPLPSASFQSASTQLCPGAQAARHPSSGCRRGAMSHILNGLVPLGMVLLVFGAQGFFLPNVTRLEKLLSRYRQDEPHSRARRAIPRSDQEEILMLHNKLRGQVHPPASNMEHMVSPHAGPGAPALSPITVVGQAWGPGQQRVPCLFLDAPPSSTREQRPPRHHLPCHLPELSPRAALRLPEGGVRGPRGWAATS